MTLPPSASVPLTPRRIPLWPGRERPELRVYSGPGLPMHRRAAVIVFRGGGYRICNGSGVGCAEWFAEKGVVGIEAEYTTTEGPVPADPSEGRLFPKPFQDAARAVRLVRKLACELEIDPNRVGVAGFSAGGHLAAMLCGDVLPCQEAAEEDLHEISFRPDVLVLSYPVISLVPHEEVRGPSNLANSAERLGVEAGEEEHISVDQRVMSEHPPTFIWHTRQDEIVPVLHSERYAAALAERNVPHKLMVYEHGPHALGMNLEGSLHVPNLRISLEPKRAKWIS